MSWLTRRTFIAGLCSALSAIPRAQQTPQRFEARADLVVADLIAVDKRSDPIRDLRVGELRLMVDGKMRPIESLELVEIPSAARAPSAVTASPPSTTAPLPVAEPPVQQTSPASRSVFVLFDEAAIRPGDERQSVDGAIAFLSTLPPTDRAAVRTLPFGRISSELTTDRNATIDSLRRVKVALPRPPQRNDPPIVLEQRACEDYQRTVIRITTHTWMRSWKDCRRCPRLPAANCS